MRDVLVTENIVGSEMETLKNDFDVVFEPDLWKSPARLLDTISEFQAIIVRNQTKVTAELIHAAFRLKIIGRAGAGLDNIDLKTATRAGVVVSYAPEQNSISVAELAMAMMLSLARKIPAADRNTRSGEWDRHQFSGVELYGKTLGIVGLGRIGYRTAVRARAFGMDIIAHDEYANPDAVIVSELRARMMSLNELLKQADFVSCHIPLSHETVGLFNYGTFCRMKPTAFFINTSRGEVVDEEALVKALKDKKIAGAALDVRQQEPPVKSSLGEMDNVILTPHIAAFTAEGQERVVSSVCRDVADILSGREAKNYVNFPKPKRI
ncbi:MAG: hydroxyacid dehydrogenase [Nitrospirae bacterium]|nr:hydroxyacid dehydrogenase [Nitrospirota bacterium]MCL5422600.1 hydroxyacid dehydrogenase [Nitrospirota bacterium]